MTMPFRPVDGATVTLSATTASSRVQFTDAGVSEGAVRLYNSGSGIVFVRFGGSSVAATVSNIPLPPGEVEVLQTGGNTYIAGITATGSATVYITPGVGV